LKECIQRAKEHTFAQRKKDAKGRIIFDNEGLAGNATN
jgi:hypothetical protein